MCAHLIDDSFFGSGCRFRGFHFDWIHCECFECFTPITIIHNNRGRFTFFGKSRLIWFQLVKIVWFVEFTILYDNRMQMRCNLLLHNYVRMAQFLSASITITATLVQFIVASSSLFGFFFIFAALVFINTRPTKLCYFTRRTYFK